MTKLTCWCWKPTIRVRPRTVIKFISAVLALTVAGLAMRTFVRYRISDDMTIPLREYTNAEYPEDPAVRSVHFGRFDGRQLRLVKRDETHFDFVVEPLHPHIARVVFRDIDVSLLTPSLPDWTKSDAGLQRIALTDRQWNRQQVRFQLPSPHVDVSGGNGFEREHLFTAELAKNCLNAGLWEVLLFVKEGDAKSLVYHGWFTFPLGHYRDLFEHNTGLPYTRHWYYLEHWFDPSGTVVPLDKLRQITREWRPTTKFDPDEPVIAAGEQIGKRRTTITANITRWQDYYDGRPIHFAAFIPPGRYSVRHPWGNEYQRLDKFERTILRKIISPASAQPLHELELVFSSSRSVGETRFVVSGFDLDALPRLATGDYPKGFYMPMGIGVPPFFQSYEDLESSPPTRSPYFSMLVDSDDRWIDHHRWAIDGPILHRDESNPNQLHVYLLSYERHALIGHFVIDTQETAHE
jgi:hypothetical protein